MKKISIDFETRSECDLKACGAWVYSQHPSTEVLCMSYKIDDYPTLIWIPENKYPVADQAKVPYVKQKLPKEVISCIKKGYTVHAYNAFFEYAIWTNICNKKMGWGHIPYSQWRCTAAKASAHALPRELGKCGRALNLDVVKSKEGHRVMLKLCKPKPKRSQKEGESIYYESDEDYATLYKYCVTDTDSEYAIDKYLRDLSPKELKIWQQDFTINRRGMSIDIPAVEAAIELLAEHTGKLTKDLIELTGGAVQTAGQRDKFLNWLWDEGLILPNMQAKTVDDMLEGKGELLEDEEITETIKEALVIRQSLSRSSTKKYQTFKNATAKDGRVRDYIMYHGASTGRITGKLVQPLNFPRGDIKNTDPVIEDIKKRDLELIGLLHGDPTKVLSSCLRGMIIASLGKDLMCCDYASIEARILSWLADDQRVLNLFRNDEDPYIDMAAKIYDILIAEVTDDQRFVGKQAELGCGYQMGPERFQGQCEQYGVELDDELCEHTIKTYRSVHKKVVRMWYNMEDTAIRATITGKPQVCNGITWFVNKGFLHAKLPSGRCLSYRNPKVKTVTTKWGTTKVSLFYMGVHPKTKQWVREQTYGGKLVENLCQAIARDIMVGGMTVAEKLGYTAILTVYDEIVAEVDEGKGSVEEFENALCWLPNWATGLPLAASGFRAKRYRK